MIININLTHEDIIKSFTESTEKLLNDIEQKQTFLKGIHNDDDRTKAHHTRKMILKWFYDNGGL